MHEPEKAKRIGKSAEKPAETASHGFKWGSYPLEELIKIRDEITQHLPPMSLRDIDMEQELLLQYHSLRKLQNDVLSDNETPVNQRAQVANSVSGVLAKIGELQQTLYDSERLKRIEKILVSVLEHLPVPVAEAFLTKYEEELEKA